MCYVNPHHHRLCWSRNVPISTVSAHLLRAYAPQNPEEQRMASYLAYQIRTDTSEVYGEGFREAMDAFQRIGLLELIRNVQRYGRYLP